MEISVQHHYGNNKHRHSDKKCYSPTATKGMPLAKNEKENQQSFPFFNPIKLIANSKVRKARLRIITRILCRSGVRKLTRKQMMNKAITLDRKNDHPNCYNQTGIIFEHKLMVEEHKVKVNKLTSLRVSRNSHYQVTQQVQQLLLSLTELRDELLPTPQPTEANSIITN